MRSALHRPFLSHPVEFLFSFLCLSLRSGSCRFPANNCFPKVKAGLCPPASYPPGRSSCRPGCCVSSVYFADCRHCDIPAAHGSGLNPVRDDLLHRHRCFDHIAPLSPEAAVLSPFPAGAGMKVSSPCFPFYHRSGRKQDLTDRLSA